MVVSFFFTEIVNFLYSVMRYMVYRKIESVLNKKSYLYLPCWCIMMARLGFSMKPVKVVGGGGLDPISCIHGKL